MNRREFRHRLYLKDCAVFDNKIRYQESYIISLVVDIDLFLPLVPNLPRIEFSG